MHKPVKLTRETAAVPPSSSRQWEVRPGQRRGFALAILVLLLGFGIPLGELARFACGSKLYSYILLIPFISLYLVWLKRRRATPASPPLRTVGGLFAFAGGLVLAVYWLALRTAIGIAGRRLSGADDDFIFAVLSGRLLLVLRKENSAGHSLPAGLSVFHGAHPGLFDDRD